MSTEIIDPNDHPKVFISYSWDSLKHKKSVKDLADSLRKHGIDCEIDLHEQSPSDGWPRWMQNQVKKAKFVLIVCTDKYYKRFEGTEEPGKGKGATWEGAIITQELYDTQGKNTKFIPVIFSDRDSHYIPTILRPATFYVLEPSEEYSLETDEKYVKLYRRLTSQPENEKRPLGPLVILKPLEPKENLSETRKDIPEININTKSQFDAFLAYNIQDKEIVYKIAEKLKEKQSDLKLCLDLDKEKTITGEHISDKKILQAIKESRCVVLFVVGNRQEKLQGNVDFIKLIEKVLLKRNIYFIFVLLPNVKELPDDYDHCITSREIPQINFREIDEPSTIEELFNRIKEPAKQKYSEKFKEYLYNDGKISDMELKRLEKLQKILGLTDNEVFEIKNKESKIIEEHKEKLDEYKQAVKNYLDKEYPLSQEIKNDLKILQEDLNLKDEDVSKLENEAHEEYQKRREENVSNVEKEGNPPHQFSFIKKKWFIAIAAALPTLAIIVLLLINNAPKPTSTAIHVIADVTTSPPVHIPKSNVPTNSVSDPVINIPTSTPDPIRTNIPNSKISNTGTDVHNNK
ncbi:hypothetical protein A6770_29995 [Nostoc minutum NIES-26]|uniref:SEFIR domain-containing protein n=1 Tax=Nostoc minutum NIES-26 TaxID=1844469 RepID=A0A367QG01_9NOSO|nr:hypothetical protein A6770_29995 [Nostoc minutum NIES-26]